MLGRRRLQAQQQAEASKQEAEATREKLRAQLNSVLATTETCSRADREPGRRAVRYGRYTLKPNAQIALAKVATILQLYPGLEGAGGGLYGFGWRRCV